VKEALSYDPKTGGVTEIGREQMAADIGAGHLVWLDINAPGDADLEFLTKSFHLAPLARHEITAPRSLPKLVSGTQSSFCAWYSLGKSGAGAPVRFTCLFGPGWLVTLHSEPPVAVEETRAAALSQPAVMGEGLGILLYNLLDAAVDGYFLAVDALSDRVDALEDTMFDRPKPSDVRTLFGLKRQMLELRKAAAPEREVVNSLLRREVGYLEKESQPYFDDLYDHMVRVIDLIDTLRDVTSGAMQIYQATISNNLNAIMKQLTIIATIMMPLTLITGIFGMNLAFPGKEGAPGFWIVMGSMLVIVAGMLAWFRTRDWI
jgi:magnesium transporter